ncbi:hypothetical protein O9G_005502 [Rozella allomycis CSF55]|uniref:Uncharacterized protein n=1 Tax=Rozella allomycis (strain CSF55) TaxID=988480 RepID=A0A075B325_ROZAC|nr:hypothetical protein O9G_005502 [Rozella allomycis CSF55]|eukprot:EPZ36749.1 hypothetical protein O9G_005502 [Rozella allomycis CSF55]
MIPSNLHSQLADLEIDGVKVNNIVIFTRENVTTTSNYIHKPLELKRAAVVNSNQNVEPIVAVKAIVQQLMSRIQVPRNLNPPKISFNKFEVIIATHFNLILISSSNLIKAGHKIS